MMRLWSKLIVALAVILASYGALYVALREGAVSYDVAPFASMILLAVAVATFATIRALDVRARADSS